MINPDVWTTKKLLEWTADYLKQNGSDSPRLDAEVLLAEAMGCQRIDLYTSFDQVPPEDQLATFRRWIQERAAGKPVAYLVGQREFYSIPFEINADVLIPRPETELLVTQSVDFLSAVKSEVPLVCDIGTGSGCISIAIAKNHSNCQFIAIDISAPAIELARKNATRHQVVDRVEFLKSDLFDHCPETGLFDLIVSNPPYIGRQEMDQLSPEVKDHEPHLALFSGETGTEIISRLVNQAPERLKPGGLLLFETSPIIMDQCLELVQGNPRLDPPQLLVDFAKQPRAIAVTKSLSP
ncbi:MAG: peptide chain release factor N(5)-glutamine methyltransferase [Planctomycetota bacterium]|nr:peptide chain release factor N(5)-glutamine methyltransferase [Planctomycetota bacterium]